MHSNRRIFGRGNYGRERHANRDNRYFQFQRRSDERETMPTYSTYYQGTSHYQDGFQDLMEIDPQEVQVEDVSGWTTHNANEQVANFDGYREEGRYRPYQHFGFGNVSHRPIRKRRGTFRGGFWGRSRFGRGNTRFFRRQKDLQKQQNWRHLDHSLRGKGHELKIDLASDDAANLSLDEIISKATDNPGPCPDTSRSMEDRLSSLQIDLSSDDAVNLSLGDIISKAHGTPNN